MKEKKIFDALTEVRDQYVEEARTTSLKKQALPGKGGQLLPPVYS